MCYRTKLTAPYPKIENTFEAVFLSPETYVPLEEINGFDFQKTPVITDEARGEIQMFHWGLIPYWAKDNGIRKSTLNARIETIREKPAFRDSVKNRCLVIADGFYEWQWLDAAGKSKQKFLVRPKDQEVFAFAGIYSSWRDPVSGETVNSYSIATTEAGELMGRIHNTKKRMPVILKREDQAKWLAGTEMQGFGFPYEVPLEASPVG